MRTVNTTLVEEYAEQLREVLPLARRAVGIQAADSPARVASEESNRLILEYVEKGGNMTHLSHELEDIISLPGLRRRLRSSRGKKLGGFSTSSKRGSTDPGRVKRAAAKIRKGREHSPEAYREAVREVYADNVSLTAVADEVGISYFALWSAGSAG